MLSFVTYSPFSSWLQKLFLQKVRLGIKQLVLKFVWSFWYVYIRMRLKSAAISLVLASTSAEIRGRSWTGYSRLDRREVVERNNRLSIGMITVPAKERTSYSGNMTIPACSPDRLLCAAFVSDHVYQPIIRLFATYIVPAKTWKTGTKNLPRKTIQKRHCIYHLSV